jgi:uncharacterized membrane protein YgcG
MKAFLSTLLFAGMLIIPAASRAQTEPERVLQYDSHVSVEADGNLLVTETIKVFAARGQIQHGIYRDFPQVYQTAGGRSLKTGFKVQRVARDGQPEDYHLAKLPNGTRVYMGSKSQLVAPGLHTYELTFSTDRQLGFFDNHDELYWNVTGNGWILPIDAVTCTVNLPGGALATNLMAYTGAQGERGRDFTSSHEGNTATFTTTRPLPPGYGLTIVVEWPKGFVSPPTQLKRLMYWSRDNRLVIWGWAAVLLVSAYYLGIWNWKGRDPRRGVIIPLYEPPPGFSPAAVRHLRRMGFDHRAFAVTIVSLAVKGAIRIEQEKKFLGGKTFTLVPESGFSGQLLPEEETVLRNLVGDGAPIALKQENHATLRAAIEILTSQLTESQKKVYFHDNWGWGILGLLLSAGLSVWIVRDEIGLSIPAFCASAALAAVFAYNLCVRRAKAWVLGLCGLIAVIALQVLGVFPSPAAFMAAAIALGLVNGIFIHLIKAPTPKGRRILDHIEGFKKYLSVAEKDELTLEDPPERTLHLFEMFLPYAMALDVEEQWSKQFTDVIAAAASSPEQSGYSPTWYSGDAYRSIGAASFVGALGGSLAGAIASSSQAPGSSSGGGGGGGGGGSSGGGGGGGGGGGW